MSDTWHLECFIGLFTYRDVEFNTLANPLATTTCLKKQESKELNYSLYILDE